MRCTTPPSNIPSKKPLSFSIIRDFITSNIKKLSNTNRVAFLFLAVLFAVTIIPLLATGAILGPTPDGVGGDITIKKETPGENPNQEFTFEIQFYNNDGVIEGEFPIKKETSNPTIFAVYNEAEHTLNFYKRIFIPSDGEMWDEDGDPSTPDKKADRVWTGFDKTTYAQNNLPPWNEYASNIYTSTVVDDIPTQSTAYWFYGMNNLETSDVLKLSTSAVSTFERMYYGCEKLTNIYGLAGLNTSNVKNMNGVFTNCYLLAGYFTKTLTGEIVIGTTPADNNLPGEYHQPAKNAAGKFIYNASDWATSQTDSTGYSGLRQVEVWDVSNVQTFEEMFANCFQGGYTQLYVNNYNSAAEAPAKRPSDFYKIDLSSWTPKNASNFRHMFYHTHCLGSIIGLSSFDTSKMINLEGMFEGSVWLGARPNETGNTGCGLDGVSNWNVSNVTNMNGLFADCAITTHLNLSSWNVSKNKNFARMFMWCSKLQTVGNINNWNTSSATNMSSMFMGAYCIEQEVLSPPSCAAYPIYSSWDLENWDLSNVTDTSYMFWENFYRRSLGDISKWKTGNVTNMEGMFTGSSIQFLDLSYWDVRKVVSFESMFAYTSKLPGTNIEMSWRSGNTNIEKISLLGWDLQSATNVKEMFEGWNSLTTIYTKPNYDWTLLPNITDYTGIFDGSPNIAEASCPNHEYTNTPTRSFSEGARACTAYKEGLFTGITQSNYTLKANPNLTGIPPVTKITYTDIKCPASVTTTYDNFNNGVVWDFDTNTTTPAIIAWIDPSDSTRLIVSTQHKEQKPIAPSTGFAPLAGLNSTIQEANIDFIDVSNVLNMSGIFENAPHLDTLDISSWDVSNVTTTNNMFQNDTTLKTVYAPLNMAWTSLTSSTNMFAGCSALTGGKGTKITSNPTNSSLARVDGIIVGDTPQNGYFTPKFTISYVLPGAALPTIPNLYYYGIKTQTLLGESAASYNGWAQESDMSESEYLFNTPISYDITNIHNYLFYPSGEFSDPMAEAFVVYSSDDNSLNFYKRSGMPSIGDTLSGRTVTYVATGFENLEEANESFIPNVYLKEIKSVNVKDQYIKPTSMRYWFANMTNCTKFDLAKLNTSEVTSMKGLFSNCQSIGELDLSTWNVSKLTNTYAMFFLCKSLTDLNLDGWGPNTGKLKITTNMFSNCYSLQLPQIENWNTISLVQAAAMFSNCTSFTSVDLRGWDVRKLVDASYMFYMTNRGLANVNLSGWNTISLSSTQGMFYECSELTTVNLSNWNTDTLTNTAQMFTDCKSLQNLSMKGWNINQTTPPPAISDATAMFKNCSSLSVVEFDNITGQTSRIKWDLSKISKHYNIAFSCPAFAESSSLSSLSLFSYFSTDQENTENSDTYNIPNLLTTPFVDNEDYVAALSDSPSSSYIDYGTLTIVNNKVIIKLRSEEILTIQNVPQGTTYTITELPTIGWTETNTENTSGQVPTTSDQPAVFENSCLEDMININLKGFVLLDNKLVTSTSNFAFNTTTGQSVAAPFQYDLIYDTPITDASGNTIYKVTVNANDYGVIDFSRYISITSPGTYTYKIKRNFDNSDRNKIVYDGYDKTFANEKEIQIKIVAAYNSDGILVPAITSNAENVDADYVYGTIVFKNETLKDLPYSGLNGIVVYMILFGFIFASVGIYIITQNYKRKNVLAKIKY